MNIRALSAFNDNYIWMWDDGRSAVVVDPGDASPVLRALETQALELEAILVTHHHADHVGGIDALRPRLKGMVYGPHHPLVPGPCVRLNDGDWIDVPGLRLRVMAIPGHTLDHIAYHAPESESGPVLFCGDTLFSAGCGRIFEGTPAQMHDSLQRLVRLPLHTRVYCTHEYTLSNLRFAAAVEPDNPDIRAYAAWCEGERSAGRPTLPSTIGREAGINPFLRCAHPTVVDAACAQGATGRDPVQVLSALREWKNRFR